ncbi:MAG: insulinase family protein, partial [Alphaproteobacteria bacterium]|nr:insulinase family protein [Alphaproteobacteria bacterium]
MLWYKVGSANEMTGKTGLAHFFEHLMFKGTTKTPEGQFTRIITEHGGNNNAFTTADATVYHQTVAKQH